MQETGGIYSGSSLRRILSKEPYDPVSPVYWHNMSGMVRNLIDRFYGPVPSGALKGRKFVFLFQGAAPEGWMMEKAEYTMSRFAKMYGMTYVGMATNEKEAKNLSGKI